MPKTILLLLITFCFISARGQNKKAVELSLVSRYDQHADYVTNFAGRSYNDTMKLSGLSNGISVQFRTCLTPAYSFYVGLGYYRLSVNHIRSFMPFNIPGVARFRNINNEDDDSTRLGYSTSKYHYNNAAITLGLSKLFFLKNKFTLDIGVEGVGYSSFSQGYELMNGYHYPTKNTKPLEFAVNVTIGFLKNTISFTSGLPCFFLFTKT